MGDVLTNQSIDDRIKRRDLVMNIQEEQETLNPIEKMIEDYAQGFDVGCPTPNIKDIMGVVANLIAIKELEAQKVIVNKLFTGWIDQTTNEDWKYLTKKHRDEILADLEQQLLKLKDVKCVK